MISQTAEYALRAIVYLADHPGEAHTAERIAVGTKVPVGYLAKIMQGLSRAKMVTSQRGLYGGFTLVKLAKDLTVYEVVQAVDPIQRIHTCPLGIEGHGNELCPLHRSLDNAAMAIEMTFKRLTIEALLNQPAGSRPLCSFPRLVDAGN
jgi:Rrf2 family transcriptional regulator, nitric oxide-sensitive transcriptional repressor